MKYVALCLLAACQTPPAEAPHTPPVSSDTACAPALPLLAKQHTPNSSKLYLAPLSIEHDHVQIGRPAVVTAKRGFVNQPSLAPDGSGLYFTWRPEGSQADIWFHDLRTGAEHPVTCTSVEEYAARQTGDGVVVVRIEPDLSRHLVKLDRTGREQQVLFPQLTTVGAYLWIDDATAMLFNPGSDTAPSALLLGDVRTGKLDEVATDVSPSMAVIPAPGPGPTDRAISYIDLHDEHQPKLMRFELATRTAAPLASLPDGVTGVTWLPDGSLVRGSGTHILRASPASAPWQELADLTGVIDGPILGLHVRDGRLVITVHVE